MGGAPGGGEPAFDGGFEDGGAVAFEIGLDAFKRSNAGVQPGELLFDLGNDAPLHIDARKRHLMGGNLIEVDARAVASIQVRRESNERT